MMETRGTKCNNLTGYMDCQVLRSGGNIKDIIEIDMIQRVNDFFEMMKINHHPVDIYLTGDIHLKPVIVAMHTVALGVIGQIKLMSRRD
jgi:hypothetical protein